MIYIYDSITWQNIPFVTWEFPGGEVGVKLSNTDLVILGNIVVKATGILSSKELVELRYLIEAVHWSYRQDIVLYMPYLPYARQDRICTMGENFSLRSFIGSFFTDLPISKLIVFDVHSDVAKKLIEGKGFVFEVEYINQYSFVKNLVKNYDVILFPDEGAFKKAQQYPDNLVKMFAEKKRVGDKVEYLPVVADLKNKKILVVDDICDGGATFISLAQALKGKGQVQLDLAVTHGIFSKGTDTLLSYYNNIFVTNLMNDDVSATVRPTN